MRHAILAFLLAAGCAPSATLDEPRLCKTVQNQLVPAVGVEGTVRVGFALDLRPELTQLGVKSGHAHVTDVTVTARDLPDLAFIHALQVTLEADGGSVAVVSYQAAAATLRLPGTGADLLPAALEGPLPLQLELDGALPAQAWHADLAVCLDVQATITGG